MKFGPDLPRDDRIAAKFGRLLQVFGLGSLATFLFAVAFSAYFVLPLVKISPEGLYHRAWQEVQDNAYDPSGLKDWAAWEHKYDGRLKTQDDAADAINEMLKSTGDHYAVFLNPKHAAAERDEMSGQFAGIGVKIAPKVDDKGEPVMGLDPKAGPLMAVDKDGNPLIEVMEDGPAAHAGLKDGDAVISINGQPVKDITMDGFVKIARGDAGSTLAMVILRDGKQQNITVVRGEVKTKAVSHKLLTAANGTRVGYIRLESFIQDDSADELRDAIAALGPVDRIILDLRFNPGGNVAVCLQVMSVFIEKGTLVSIRQRDSGAGWTKTTYVASGNGITETSVADPADGSTSTTHLLERMEPVGGKQKLVVLVNGSSASAAEMFTGAMKDHKRATIIGERTFGKGIGQSIIPMPGRTSLHITSLRYFTPNGTWLGDGGNGNEKYGVDPDIVVKLDEKPGIKLGDPGKDNQLDTALQFISR